MGDQKQINWKGVVFYIIVGAIFVVTIAYVIWPQGIIRVTITSLFAKIQWPNLQTFRLDGLFAWLKENSVVAGLLVTLGSTALGALIKNYQTGQANKTLDKKLLELETKNLELANDTSKVDALQKKIDELNADTTASDLQKRINTFNDERLQWEAQVKSLQSQNQELMNMLAKTPVKIVEVVK